MIARLSKATPESWKYSGGSQEDAAEAEIDQKETRGHAGSSNEADGRGVGPS